MSSGNIAQRIFAALHPPVVFNADNAGEASHQKSILIYRGGSHSTDQNIFDFFEAAAFLALSQKVTKISLPTQAEVAPLVLEAHEWPDTSRFLGGLSNYRIVAYRNLDKEPNAIFLKVLIREGFQLFKSEGAQSFKTVFRATMFQDTRRGGKNDKILFTPVVGQPADPCQTTWGAALKRKAKAAHDRRRFSQILIAKYL